MAEATFKEVEMYKEIETVRNYRIRYLERIFSLKDHSVF